MIVGIDVHKRSHAAAIVDERGAVIATLTIANSRDGVRRLRRWLGEHDAEQATVGVENAAGYGRLVCAVLAAGGHEVLNVPAWRVHRERPQQGPGKSDPDDSVAIAVCVLRYREKLGPALEPPLIRAIAFLETHRRQSVTRRTDAIQRLRAVWARVDPEAEADVPNIAAAKALRRLKRLELGNGLAEQAAARCIHDLAGEIEALNTRVAELETELQALLSDTAAPFDDLPRCRLRHHGHADRPVRRRAPLPQRRRLRPLRRLRPDPVRLGRDRWPSPSAPRRQPPGQRLPSTASPSPSPRVDPNARAFLTRKIADGKTKREARRALKRHLSGVVYRRLHTWADQTLPPLPFDIGASSDSSPATT